MVEILGGALAGGAVEEKLASRNWGSLVLALDPALAGDGDVAAFQVGRLRPPPAMACILQALCHTFLGACNTTPQPLPRCVLHQPAREAVMRQDTGSVKGCGRCGV